jgi:hypothetical protein
VNRSRTSQPYSRDKGGDRGQIDARQRSRNDESYDQYDKHDSKREPILCRARSDKLEEKMLGSSGTTATAFRLAATSTGGMLMPAPKARDSLS